MIVDKDKQYRTRDGREVRIYATDGHPEEPVHGAFKDYSGRWVQSIWELDGRCKFKMTAGTGEVCVDLVEVKPLIKRTYWVNLYNGSNRSGLFDAKADANLADKQTSLGVRIACVKVEIDCEKGEGL